MTSVESSAIYEMEKADTNRLKDESKPCSRSPSIRRCTSYETGTETIKVRQSLWNFFSDELVLKLRAHEASETDAVPLSLAMRYLPAWRIDFAAGGGRGNQIISTYRHSDREKENQQGYGRTLENQWSRP